MGSLIRLFDYDCVEVIVVVGGCWRNGYEGGGGGVLTMSVCVWIVFRLSEW